MNYFDIVIGVILILGLVKGFKNGLVIELAALAALVLGLLGAVHFSDITESYLAQYLESNYIGIIAFVITFVVIVIGVHLLARVIDKLIKAVALGPVNRITGALFSLLKYAFIISVLLAVVNGLERNFNFLPEEQKESSILYEPIASIAPFVFPYLKFDTVREQYEDATKGVKI
ncbi:MAG: CvpA family protein [Marinilabiliaceae bacterium]|nr:CvpA family protein [Marinilabiliaceae bacterium]